MIDRDVSTAAPGVTRHDCHWGYYFEGRMADLVRSGIAEPDWFTDGTERDNAGRTVRTRRFTHKDGRQIECHRPKRGVCTLRVLYTEAELEANMERKHFEKMLAEEKKELSQVPASHDEYRKKISLLVSAQVEFLVEFWCHPNGSGNSYTGYHYDEAVLTEAGAIVQELRGLLESGRTIFRADIQRTRIAEIKAKTASANPALRSFLNSLSDSSLG